MIISNIKDNWMKLVKSQKDSNKVTASVPELIMSSQSAYQA